MNKLGLSALVSALALLSACGGGSGSSGGTVNTPPTGSTPSPGGSATIFQASGAGPLVAQIYFDANGNGAADAGEPTTSTDATGAAGVSVAGLGPSQGGVPSGATMRLRALGADSSTGFLVSDLSAPRGATVISPVTTIIDLAGDQAAVRRAFGMLSGPNTIRETTDLLSFAAAQRLNDPDSATAQDAARITAVNFRIIALMQLLSRYQGDPVDVGSGAGPEGAQYISAVIRETGSADFSDAGFVLRTLQKASFHYQPEQLEVAAEAFAKFMRSVPTSMSTPQEINGYHLAFRFFVLANIRSVYAAYPSPELARVRALTDADWRAAVARFADVLRPPVGSRVYALPDYVELRGAKVLSPATLLRNDVSGFPYSVGASGKTITSITVDPRFFGQVHARLEAGNIELYSSSSFNGYAYFDYTALSGGTETSARVYLQVRQP